MFLWKSFISSRLPSPLLLPSILPLLLIVLSILQSAPLSRSSVASAKVSTFQKMCTSAQKNSRLI